MASKWEFYLRPEEAWEAMYTDCRRAERSIDLEEYIFLNDSAGSPLYEILKAKARSGVRVRVILDSAGSFSVTHSESFLKELDSSGVQVQIFNPIGLSEINNVRGWFMRDHRKIMVVDGRIGHIGGVCLDASMRSWRDTQIRIESPVVSQMNLIFERMWLHGLKRRYGRMRKLPSAPDNFQILINSPIFHKRYLYHELLNRIRSARERIYITTPYFIPNYRFFNRLRRAARRGVDVRILLADKSDHSFVDSASDFHIGPALRRGMRVYKYTEAVLHAKAAVIDGWATVGSTNIDNLSLLLNHEANLAGSDALFVKENTDIFLKDIGRSRELNFKDWNSRSWKTKLAERITWPAHRLL